MSHHTPQFLFTSNKIIIDKKGINKLSLSNTKLMQGINNESDIPNEI